MVTQSDVDNIQFFMESRGDPSRYVDFDRIAKERPELRKAYDDWITAKKILRAVVKSLECDEGQEEIY